MLLCTSYCYLFTIALKAFNIALLSTYFIVTVSVQALIKLIISILSVYFAMTNRKKESITVNNISIDYVDEYTYLDQIIRRLRHV